MSDYTKCLKYIKSYWKEITWYHPKDKQLHLGLPNKYISPNKGIFKFDQFYWDTYFTILGLVKAGKVPLAKGMIDNFLHLHRRFGIIPMRNRYYNLGGSQIPFLTSMAREVYELDKDKKWLDNVMKVAEAELQSYWMNEHLTEKHIVYKGLSRYCDHYITHLGAEHESGWDMTSRFGDRCLDYLPVDLNSCLYKYETDLADYYESKRSYAKAKKFRAMAAKRKKNMIALMWDEEKKFFLDYNKYSKERSTFLSMAGFYTLWANLATTKQARLMRDHALAYFEYEGGISNTQTTGLSKDTKQHDHPNGWPHQQWIVIKGLLNYGFREDAERIALKWVNMNVNVFNRTGLMWEKYDVVSGDIGVFNPDRYPTQSGFGWTNAIFLRLVKEFNFDKKRRGTL